MQLKLFQQKSRVLKVIPQYYIAHPYCVRFLRYYRAILVPRAYDPSGLRQESRALGATISGMRHRCRL